MGTHPARRTLSWVTRTWRKFARDDGSPLWLSASRKGPRAPKVRSGLAAWRSSRRWELSRGGAHDRCAGSRVSRERGRTGQAESSQAQPSPCPSFIFVCRGLVKVARCWAHSRGGTGPSLAMPPGKALWLRRRAVPDWERRRGSGTLCGGQRRVIGA